jgi:hypothetical protein
MVLSNLTEKHQLELRLIATGGSTGIASGDVVTFTRGGSSFGVTWATNQTGGQAVVYNNGSVADDIEKSALAFVDAINSHASNTFLDAFYLSGADDSPGLVLLRARDFSTTQFTVSASAHINAYTPELSAAKTKAHSTQVQMANGVAWCKPSQPDACPLVNRQPVGDSLEKNLRVVAIRDRVFLVKERSVWEMTGVYGAWRFDMLDNTVAVVGPDTVVALNNQLFALTTQGPATISTVGVGLLTAPVELDFSTLFANNLANAKVSSWGAAYENEHQYLLGIPTSGSAAVDYVYVWNFMTAAWTRWPMLRKCAAVDPTTTLLWLGDSGTATARRERKTFQFSTTATRRTPPPSPRHPARCSTCSPTPTCRWATSSSCRATTPCAAWCCRSRATATTSPSPTASPGARASPSPSTGPTRATRSRCRCTWALPAPTSGSST